MYKKIVLLLAVVCLIQAAPTDDFSDLKEKLEAAAVKVASVIKESGERVGQTYKQIEKGISVLDRDINVEKRKIDEAANQAQEDAKASGKDISACIQQEKAGQRAIHRRDLELCRFSPDLNKLSLKIAALSKLEVVLGTAPVKCAFQNRDDTDKIKPCIVDIIADVENQADEAEKNFDAEIKQAVYNTSQCVSKAVEPIKAQIKKINEDFADCIKKA